MSERGSPVVLQLLGQWNNSQINFPLPSRNDFFVRQSRNKLTSPYILINQFLLCHEHPARVHFPKADSSLYPDALQLDEQPQIDYEDLVPSVREGQLLNWNLEDESPTLTQQDPLTRVRRQAGQDRADKLEKIKRGLGPNESYISAYFFNPKISKTYENAYAKFCKSFIAEINRTFVAQVADHFSNIWKANANFTMVAIVADATRENGDFVISIVIPPYCTLAFNDCSVMQALGFDVVNQTGDPGSILKRTTNDELPWHFTNNTSSRKVINGKRAIPNVKMSSLRIKARAVREKLTPNVKAATPELTSRVVLGTDDVFTISLEFAGNVKSPPAVTTEWPENFDVLMVTGTTVQKLEATKNFFENLLTHLCTFYGFHPQFYELIPEPDEQRLTLTQGSLHPHQTKDQLTVEFVLGEKAYNYFLANSKLENPLLWNYGVQSPLPIKIATDESSPLLEPALEEEDRPSLPVEEAEEEEGVVVVAVDVSLSSNPDPVEAQVTTDDKTAIIKAIEIEGAIQKSDEELIEVKRRNAIVQEQLRREQAQKLIDLSQSLTEKKKLILAETERQAQAIMDLEANYQRDLENKKKKHEEAVASIAAEQKKMEDQVKASLEQQQTQWLEEEADLARQLAAGATKSQEFLADLLKQKQDAEDLHRQMIHEKKGSF